LGAARAALSFFGASFPTCDGKAFTDRLFGLRRRAATGAQALARLCAELHIEHRLTPPASPQTNGMVERFNSRIYEGLQSHRVRSGEDPETTLNRRVRLCNQPLPQSALGSKSPFAGDEGLAQPQAAAVQKAAMRPSGM
jgi:transposase InsO family protein